MMKLTTFLFIGLSVAVPVFERDVFVPPITSVKPGEVWRVGEQRNVSWDTSNAPAQITNQVGKIMLRKADKTTNNVLASGFDIKLGSIGVTVPTVEPADDYALVLFGDSGNFSPKFTIAV